MNNHTNSAQASAPMSLHLHAEDNLRYICNAMESSTSLTGVTGKRYVPAGIPEVAATGLAAQQANATALLSVGMAEFALAAAITLARTTFKTSTTLGMGILHSTFGIIVWRKYGG